MEWSNLWTVVYTLYDEAEKESRKSYFASVNTIHEWFAFVYSFHIFIFLFRYSVESFTVHYLHPAHCCMNKTGKYRQFHLRKSTHQIKCRFIIMKVSQASYNSQRMLGRKKILDLSTRCVCVPCMLLIFMLLQFTIIAVRLNEILWFKSISRFIYREKNFLTISWVCEWKSARANDSKLNSEKGNIWTHTSNQ